MTTATQIQAEQEQRLEELMMPSATPSRPRPRPTRKTSPGMRTKLLAEAAEQTVPMTGEFHAKVSDFGVDRQGERFAPTAFDNAIETLRRESRAVPTLFGHDQQSVTAIVGSVPPTGWSVTAEGLFARGWIDVSDPVGVRLVEMLKRGALAWSVGFTIKKKGRIRDGVRELTEVGELLELSIVPVPANSRTRTLELKGTVDADDVPDPEDEPISHVALERRLAAEGIIGPLLDSADDVQIANRNGDEREKAVSTKVGISVVRIPA